MRIRYYIGIIATIAMASLGTAAATEKNDVIDTIHEMLETIEEIDAITEDVTPLLNTSEIDTTTEEENVATLHSS
ncbi:MAG: hypothetical protein HN411_04755 [Waddliaceae bacterium]|jgi:hypothetical protein|nr:hypothetical protein [Waddliaceae bacterium]MBT3579269.1 hypothetical protein [Waddliaceae bacterium]MBT4444586.1 hypothetical protein [Waddliaceae bacterium]MBT6928462.1 hypothetical protein [Waddliaceae bacterium]MBT7264108.1 hypothetical protein [Waddliaceae bacterium]